MKLKQIDFKIRYYGDSFITIKTEIVQIESDSSEEEEIEQIREYYHKEVVMAENGRIAQTYRDYEIKNHDFKF